MTAQYRDVLDKGREPALDEFETIYVDDALDEWANEDNDILDAMASRDDPNEWEEVDT